MISVANLPHSKLMYGLIQRHRRLKCAFTRVFLPLMSPTFFAAKLIGGMQFSAIQSAQVPRSIRRRGGRDDPKTFIRMPKC